MSTTLERKLTAWNDPDREGAWRLFTLCRGCAVVKFCRGKERDRVICKDCFLSDAQVVPFFELGLWDYADAAGAKREHARGLAILEQRKAEVEEARKKSLELARIRRLERREERNREIVRLVSDGMSYEAVGERFGLKPGSVQKLVSQSERCLANPHGYAAKSTQMTDVVTEPLSLPTPAQKSAISAPSGEAREKRRKTFERRAERQRLQVQELAKEGIVRAEIADRLGLSDRTVRKHLGASKGMTRTAKMS